MTRERELRTVDAVDGAEFARPKAGFAQPTTIQHWQLRDLVHCVGAHDVYCVYNQQVVRYDTAACEREVMQNLRFCPTSMAVGHGYLAAGGSRSELEVMQLHDRSTLFSQVLGGNVNNALHIGRDYSGELKLFVCNNDDTIKVVRLPTMEVAATIHCAVPINYCSLSPDGQYLACVGDSHDVYLYRCGRSSDYDRVAKLSEAHDHGMSCAWSPTGSCFAAASQDGLVCVWDLKSRRPLAKFSTALACRSVKFSRGPIDLLAFSEHESSVHLVDARTFGTQQTLLPVNPERDGLNVSGISFSPDGSRFYVGLDEALQMYEVESAKRRSFPQGTLV
mmetsp:Transcript_17434/g.49023  ORF Transcript_17434/g.49023 Transcript_17434/m.49023 type:complete len:334 (-) Transcript_17434:439-1440(-)